MVRGNKVLKNINKIPYTIIRQIIIFFSNRLKEINPWQNFKLLHTNIKNDIIAGITVAIIALPLALAFGEMSQLGPEAGMWSAIAGGIIGGLFGGCLFGVSGPTAPMASQITVFMGAFIIGTSNQPDILAAFSIIFLSGLILIGMSILNISKFIHYIPYSVIGGFMCGIGMIISTSQITTFLGIKDGISIYELLTNYNFTLQNINIESLYVSIPSLLIIFIWPKLEKLYKSLSKIPSPFIALIIGSSIAYFLNLDISYIGDKMNISNQKKAFSIYIPHLHRLNEFIGPAFALAGLAILDSLLSCKVADNMTGIRHNSNRETFGQGMANMAAGLFGGISTATATTQTVGNVSFGAKTPLATIIKGLTMLAILSGLGFLVAAIPNACLAAILFKLGFDILDYRILPIIKKLPKIDILIFTIVFFITIYKDLMIAVAIGIFIASILSIKNISLILKSTYTHKNIKFSKSIFAPSEISLEKLNRLPIQVLQPQGPLFFGSIESLLKIYSTNSKHKLLILDLSFTTMIDLSGTYALEDLINLLKTKKIKVFTFCPNSKIQDVLKRLNFITHCGNNNFFFSKKSIITNILKQYNIDN